MPTFEKLLVVSLEQAVAAPLCSGRLADAGARVIKIEREGGDFARNYDAVVRGESAYFIWLNRGKESLVLDIKDPKDANILRKLISKADVFIQNLLPGAAARAGLDSSLLRQEYPNLITCDISGYGDTGSYADMKAYDLLVQAETGLCSITGTEEAPGRVGVSVCDIAAGLNAYSGILEALYSREKTGRGVGVKVSLFAGMADWMNVPYLYQIHTGKPLGRHGLHHPSIAPYGAFPASDGKMVLLSIQNEREWGRLCREVFGRPELETDPRFDSPSNRGMNRSALDEVVRESFARWPRAKLMDELRKAGIACGALNDTDDLIRHPQLRTIEYGTPTGDVRVIAPPVEFSDGNRCYGPVPELGEHNKAIRSEMEGEPNDG
jgi:itaconate CoA-transferase